jgi:hypothetical protein
MRLYQLATRFALVWAISAGPALAQNPSTPPAASAQTNPGTSAENVPTSPGANEAFLTGLRRIGVMGGQVVACAPEKDRQEQISQAMDLANLIAIHFGLKAAFTFVGALGYGSGNPFDKAACPQAIDGWKQIKAKYLNK